MEYTHWECTHVEYMHRERARKETRIGSPTLALMKQHMVQLFQVGAQKHTSSCRAARGTQTPENTEKRALSGIPEVGTRKNRCPETHLLLLARHPGSVAKAIELALQNGKGLPHVQSVQVQGSPPLVAAWAPPGPQVTRCHVPAHNQVDKETKREALWFTVLYCTVLQLMASHYTQLH